MKQTTQEHKASPIIQRLDISNVLQLNEENGIAKKNLKNETSGDPKPTEVKRNIITLVLK